MIKIYSNIFSIRIHRNKIIIAHDSEMVGYSTKSFTININNLIPFPEKKELFELLKCNFIFISFKEKVEVIMDDGRIQTINKNRYEFISKLL